MRGERGFKKYLNKPVTVYYESESGAREYMSGLMTKLDGDELTIKFFDNTCWEWRYVGINLHGNLITKVIVAAKFVDETTDPLPQ